MYDFLCLLIALYNFCQELQVQKNSTSEIVQRYISECGAYICPIMIIISVGVLYSLLPYSSYAYPYETS